MDQRPIHHTAILIFARTAEAEIKEKKFPDGIPLFQALNERVRNVVAKTGLPYYFVDESLQQGDSFSLRFFSAFQSLFRLGYKNVISVGNDSPDLSVELLNSAIESLENERAVIGPARDGGIYLLGMGRDTFRKSGFKSLPWQTRQLRSALIAQLKNSECEFTLLDVLGDLDSVHDLRNINFRQIADALKAVLLSLLPQPIRIFSHSHFNRMSVYPALHLNKGSPC